ncbi:MAG: SAM-dependent methyltransferase [Candidatus Marinimicrobia bacterium CG08_land_8_20_14_0_20_45_22]|nr:MAG: SAM-dependent methyltransferase [Candidatus Marinimicrobia bacterium CG08_land_8_20_14_0_20_45_22]
MKLTDILKDSNYDLSLFTENDIKTLEAKIKIANNKPYVDCIIREKEVHLKPEEVIRQLYTAKLINDYDYPKKRIRFEHPVRFGSTEIKSADIVILDKDSPTTAYIIVEVKKPKRTDGKEQLKSYCHATGAPIAVWLNGKQISYFNRKNPNFFEDITNIPKVDQTLEDILKERFTWRDLIVKDILLNNRITLKAKIEDMENEVLANAGVDVFEEVFKLIFTKLYDENKSYQDRAVINYFLKNKNLPLVAEPTPTFGNTMERSFDDIKAALRQVDASSFRLLEFRNTGQTDAQLKEKIQRLFDEAKKKWPGVFSDESKIDLSPSHLSICVSSLQDVKLFNSNLQVIDEAFEYLVSKSAKGEKGQYFTPRHVIDMCVKMLNPQRGEYMIDPASGSCGFTVHTIFQITGHLFENTEISAEEKDDVLKVFGIDFDEKVVRVARTLNLIAGDGETNVLHLNTLDYDRWHEKVNNPDWRDTYGAGFRRLESLKVERNSNKEFLFDILMANPPFAGDIKESNIIHKYDLGFNAKKKPKSKVGRDILFIERNLDFLKPGGRLAIVLPQGRFNNTSDKDIREFITGKARILAVVGLHGNTFKPHTGTKTSVLFLQKWDDKLCPKKDDYPIFFAVSDKSGKDNSGDYVYVKNDDGKSKLDKYGHLVVDHDLHNHNGELPDGIAETFIDWAKKEKMSFWK